MNYVVLDFEANDGDYKEIIEIGAVKLNENLEQIGIYQSLVKPLKNRKLGSYIKTLTGITQENVDNARSFVEVHEEFANWVGEDSKIIVWGSSDKKFLIHDVLLNNIESPLLNKFKNIQKKVSRLLLSDQEIGLKKIVSELKVENDGIYHRALIDAVNTAKIFVLLFNLLDLKENNNKLQDTEYFEFKKFIKNRSIEEMEVELAFLYDKIKEELSNVNRVNDDYEQLRQKYIILNGLLMQKKRAKLLKDEGIKNYHLEMFKKNAVILDSLFNCIEQTKEAKTFLIKTKRSLNRFNTNSKKYLRVRYLNLRRASLSHLLKEMLNTTNSLITSRFLSEDFNDKLMKVKADCERMLKELSVVNIRKVG